MSKTCTCIRGQFFIDCTDEAAVRIDRVDEIKILKRSDTDYYVAAFLYEHDEFFELARTMTFENEKNNLSDICDALEERYCKALNDEGLSARLEKRGVLNGE